MGPLQAMVQNNLFGRLLFSAKKKKFFLQYMKDPKPQRPKESTRYKKNMLYAKTRCTCSGSMPVVIGGPC